ncbi:MAG: hypothetical protein MRY57_04045 [Candidatus Pacebacteria bacterium]|nr:hypothetical protein [Candidatus Paceibacterota bacterium]
MNDPLRDNRIFPEEMHDKQPEKEPTKSNLTWLWTLLIICAVLALVWFGYRYYQKNLKPVPEQLPETQIPDQETQQEVFESVRDSAPELERVERQERINTLFGNN